jgi:hypothetical protein
MLSPQCESRRSEIYGAPYFTGDTFGAIALWITAHPVAKLSISIFVQLLDDNSTMVNLAVRPTCVSIAACANTL